MKSSATALLLLLATFAPLACSPGGLHQAPSPPRDGPASTAAPPTAASSSAAALVELALARMGGAAALRAIERVRYELMTQWQITTFDRAPYPERISYELDTDLRDYTLPAWRNTRRFPDPRGGEWRTVVDLVRGDVGARDFGQGFAPLNIAYVDERDELFAYTPDRLMLAAAADPGLTRGPDTVMAGRRHARVLADVGPFDATIFLAPATALPAMVRFRAAAPNDFGLVPWGPMEVEVWYSGWRAYPDGLSLPSQWDIRRVGRTYKRITVLSAAFNPEIAADSFAIADSVRSAYHATATRPMHDLPLDSARIVDGDFIEFRTFGAPAGAVRVGGRWVLLETGQAPLSLRRALGWMRANAYGAPELAVVASVTPGNGGVAIAASEGLTIHAGPGALPVLERILRNHGRTASDIRPLRDDRWLTVGTDSLRIERLDLPDAPGSLVVWSPSLRWLWAPTARTSLDRALVRERARERTWDVAWLGHARALRVPFE